MRPRTSLVKVCPVSRVQIHQVEGNMKPREITKILGSRWTLLDETEKTKYREQAEQENSAALAVEQTPDVATRDGHPDAPATDTSANHSEMQDAAVVDGESTDVDGVLDEEATDDEKTVKKSRKLEKIVKKSRKRTTGYLVFCRHERPGVKQEAQVRRWLNTWNQQFSIT